MTFENILNGSATAGAVAKLTYLRIGPFLGDNLSCYVDDVLVDSASMPSP